MEEENLEIRAIKKGIFKGELGGRGRNRDGHRAWRFTFATAVKARRGNVKSHVTAEKLTTF